MDIKEILENLKQLDEEQLNEMTLKDVPCHGNADSIKDAYEKLQEKKDGSYIVPDVLRIKKIVTQEDIDFGYAKDVQKDVEAELKYPIKIVYGEKDIYKNGDIKRGHGISHAETGHKSFPEALSNLSNILLRNVAKYDNRPQNVNGNYIIDTTKYRYAFGLKNGYAILITALKK